MCVRADGGAVALDSGKEESAGLRDSSAVGAKGDVSQHALKGRAGGERMGQWRVSGGN